MTQDTTENSSGTSRRFFCLKEKQVDCFRTLNLVKRLVPVDVEV